MSSERKPAGPRCVALIGPQSAGKTSLAEALLNAAGAIPRKGTIKEGNTVGDSSDEARARQMSTEVNMARFSYLGEEWSILDCPGAVELSYLSETTLMAADAAVVVCEPVIDRIAGLQPVLRTLNDLAIPHIIFINKMDNADVRVRDLMDALQQVSARKLILRQVPIRDGESITGYVDLIPERAYKYKPGEASELIQIPGDMQDREQEARQELLESLADFDDALLEQLLEDVQPARDEIYEQLKKDLASDLIAPVMLGAAEPGFGVIRLLKSLRHDAPTLDETVERLGLPDGSPMAQVFATSLVPHAGRMSYARVWRGDVALGQSLGGLKIGGMYSVQGGQTDRLDKAGAGEIVAFNRLEEPQTGDILSGDAISRPELWPEPPAPVYGLAVAAENRGDEVKLTGALQKLCEEDASLRYGHVEGTGQLVLEGQGEIQLQIALDHLRRKFNVAVTGSRPEVPYKETIRKPKTQHARFKRQTGGHGQFADVTVEIAPLPRGTGFTFTDKVVGGAVPRGFIPAVERGVNDYLDRGPLGFPVVDVSVTLVDGQHHAVDSSEQAFRTAGRQAMAEALPDCQPILLEQIWKVSIGVPSEHTPRMQRLLSTRRGQIQGFDSHPSWSGWDRVDAFLPRSEMSDLIVEIRSLTQGVGSYTAEFDHLSELSGRDADKVVEQRKEAD
ncbi:MAG: elongation factor G [Pseudomonadota bacterium]